MAEGNYDATFSDVNPGFTSQSWTDHQNDRTATKVQYENCTLSNGGALSSLTVELWDQHGIFPDAVVGSPKNTTGCGAVSWSAGLNDSTFFWKIDKINNSYDNRWLAGGSSATY